MKAIVCGAGIAGLSTAFWLARGGWDVLLVEKARGPREEGYMIDFFGSGYDVAERMGLLTRLIDIAYRPPRVEWVNRDGREQASLEYDLFRKVLKGRVFSLMRGDLERTLYESLPAKIELRFNETIAEMHSIRGGVDLTFSGGERMRCDLLVGADGVHSRVRTLVFGPEAQYLRYLGFHTAAYLFENASVREALAGRFLIHSVPKREVGLYALRDGRIASFFVHASPDPAHPVSPLANLNSAYEGMGWLVPEALKAGEGATSIYYDQVAQIEMDGWRKGHVVLVGDAAYAVSLLAGQGASLAMGGAFVLAQELGKPGPIEKALVRYEARLKPQMAKKQAAGRNAAKWIVPPDRLHILMRNWSLKLAKLPGLSGILGPVFVAGSESVVD